MELERKVGLLPDGRSARPDRALIVRSILLKLAATGYPLPDDIGDQEILKLGRDLFARYREQARLLSEHLNPADRRIQAFLDRQFRGLGLASPVRLAAGTFILDRHGLARELSL